MEMDLKSIQKVQYRILCETDRICRKHDIPYFLGQGTLLGAVKYKGFIPWDDDIDVLIPHDALKRLMKVFPEEADPEYFLTNYRVEKHMPLSWSKIRAVNTLSRPKRYKDIPINWGICIDLFPVYPICNLSLIRRAEEFLFRSANKIIMAEFTEYEEEHGRFERFLEKIPLWLRHRILSGVEHLLALHGNKSKYVLLPCKGIKVIRRSMIFGEPAKLLFEDREFPVPSDYDGYLTLNFGDYMAPLPADRQKGHDFKMGEIEWRL
ncbi:MAG: LicD family protein [Oscillospiraceae bacterium]|nr:LicD family protein [Oscillospiraceae bacterium]